MSVMPPHATGAARCERCDKDLDLLWAFCPSCGEDNRAPERRHDAIAGHKHDFQFGPHCVWCGENASGFLSAKSLEFEVSPWYRIGGVALIAAGGFGLYLALSAGGWEGGSIHGRNTIEFLVLGGLALVVGLYHLLMVRRTLVDPGMAQVVWFRGVWPVVLQNGAPFTAFDFIGLYSRWHSSRYGGYYSYRSVMHLRDGRWVFLTESNDFDVSSSDGQRAAYAISIPFTNQAVQRFGGWLGL